MITMTYPLPRRIVLTIILILGCACNATPQSIIRSIDLKKINTGDYQYRIRMEHGSAVVDPAPLKLESFARALDQKKYNYRAYIHPEDYITILIEESWPADYRQTTDYVAYFKNLEHAKKVLSMNNELLGICATESGFHSMRLEELLDAGADVNAIGNGSALYQAILNKNTGYFRILMKYGADVNIIDDEGNTPISQASWRGFLECVTMLVERGAKIDFGEKPPMCWASYRGNIDVLKYLLSKGADVNHGDYQGVPPLAYAAQAGENPTIDFLLKNRADANRRDSFGYTPIYQAIEFGRLESVKLLMKHGADAVNKDCGCYSPLQKALIFRKTNIAEYLINHKVRVDEPGSFDEYPIHSAARYGDREILGFLLEKGADINTRDSRAGLGPLHYAVVEHNLEALQFLVSKGANINLRTTGDYKTGFPPREVIFPANSTALDMARKVDFKEAFEYLSPRKSKQ